MTNESTEQCLHNRPADECVFCEAVLIRVSQKVNDVAFGYARKAAEAGDDLNAKARFRRDREVAEECLAAVREWNAKQ